MKSTNNALYLLKYEKFDYIFRLSELLFICHVNSTVNNNDIFDINLQA